MSKRKYEPGAFAPCSPKHKSCSPAHSALVAGYRNERIRQEMLFEAETNGYKGEEEIWLQNNTMITFKTWLKSNKRSETCTEPIKSTMNQNEVDQIFNQMMSPLTDTGETLPTPCEPECNCDCDMCCRNDHIACDNDDNPCCQENLNAET